MALLVDDHCKRGELNKRQGSRGSRGIFKPLFHFVAWAQGATFQFPLAPCSEAPLLLVEKSLETLL